MSTAVPTIICILTVDQRDWQEEDFKRVELPSVPQIGAHLDFTHKNFRYSSIVEHVYYIANSLRVNLILGEVSGNGPISDFTS